MATYIQRWQALGEALLGKPATTAQLARLGDAIAASTPIMGGTPYAQMTNALKAEFCIKTMHRHCVGLVKRMDTLAAQATVDETVAAVDTEFAEAP